MNVLQIIAHPDIEGKSFTGQLAESFRNAARSAGHEVTYYNLFEEDAHEVDPRPLILNADHICFAWPCWWEMPPAKLVDFLQTVFVKDFAFTLQGDRMVPSLNIPTTCLISMGQRKGYDTTNLREAMTYCGLHPMFCIFDNVGPRLSKEMAQEYLALAARQGKAI